jgi:hypothetical protein
VAKLKRRLAKKILGRVDHLLAKAERRRTLSASERAGYAGLMHRFAAVAGSRSRHLKNIGVFLKVTDVFDRHARLTGTETFAEVMAAKVVELTRRIGPP